MKFRALIFILSIFLILPFSGFSQKSLDSLKNILNSKLSNNTKEKKVEEFIKNNKSRLIPEDLANCYQEYGKWFFLLDMKNRAYLEKAISYTEKALKLKKEHNVNSKSIKGTLYNLGYFYAKQKNYFKAIDYFEQIKEISEVDSNTLKSLRELSNIYMKTGDFYKTLNNLNTLIRLSYKDTLWREKTIQAYQYRAMVYSFMGLKRFSKNIKEDVRKADSLLNLLTKKRTRYHNRLDQIEGNRLLENGNYEKAIIFFEKILKVINKKKSINVARTYNSLGQSYSKNGNYKSAFLNFNKAILYDPMYSPVYENIGDIYIAQKEYQLGLKQFQKAINILTKTNFNPKQKLSKKILGLVQQKYFLLHHLTQKAKGWIQYYKAEKKLEYLRYALETFKTADQLIDIIRFESSEYKSKLYWREQGASLYVGAVEVCFLLNKPEEAFYFMEKNKAILLLEDISNYQAIENAKLPLTLANKEVQLKTHINTVESQLQQVMAKKENRKDSLQRQLYLSKRAYATFVDSLVVAYPEYGKYKKQIPIISYEKAETTANTQNTLFLQYITTDAKGYGMLIGGTKPLVFEITNANTLPKDLEDYQNIVTQKFVTTEQQQAFCTTANRLFQKLIPQAIYEELKDKQVIIIPDYRLQELSFETLTTLKNTTDYLLKEAEISYAYSISYLENNNNLTRNAKDSFLAVAPVDFESLQLPSLHYTNTEANALATIFSGNLLLNNQATKTSFLDQGGNYKALHLATHAEVGNSIDPWIAFHDHKLSLQELYGYKNQHDLVTLSACKTSLGELKLGEGVMSLTRGFFYGGAKSVVSSLWATNDKANQQIMVSFYKQLKEGVSKSKALRQAKLHYLKTHQGTEASPLYWGGNILVGDIASINLTNSFFSEKLQLVAILGVLLLIVWISWFFLKLKKKMKE
ncbi:CHAT domain-containing protein [Tenacibaculum agarivorans]|uniref:CHAT domain-containing protein n=1 Tax=Tenacibaculum agarivorans TaxID=1908389 RepID=UPI00094B7DE2|nr:CHAT domain-containing protein [Tenacibaculum agarivorans]